MQVVSPRYAPSTGSPKSPGGGGGGVKWCLFKKLRHVFLFVLLECLSVNRLDLCGEYVTRSSDKNDHRLRRKINSNHLVMGISIKTTVILLLVSSLY